MICHEGNWDAKQIAESCRTIILKADFSISNSAFDKCIKATLYIKLSALNITEHLENQLESLYAL